MIKKREEFPCLEGVNVGYWSWMRSVKDLKIKGHSSGFIGCETEYTDKMKADSKAGGIELGLPSGQSTTVVEPSFNQPNTLSKGVIGSTVN